MMRALFFGTPEIAVPSLEALTEIADVVGVVCQPDKPAGRGLELKPPPVKRRALELGLEVAQPTKVRTPEFAEWVRSKQADVALVIAYGRILPKAVLEAPRRGCMNLHASMLPKYRGAAPITWAVVDGETRTGIALMQMDEGMDTGPVFATREVAIGPETTSGELSELLARCAASVTRELLTRAVDGELVASPQSEQEATHARMLTKDDGRIDWSKSAQRVHDHVRGMTPWPGAFTHVGEGAARKTLKVLATRLGGSSGANAAPGTVVLGERGRVEIACGEGSIELVRAQVEGKKPLAASELVSGRALAGGMVLGGPT
jgi:methionyl-tRNA formyltransferase